MHVWTGPALPRTRRGAGPVPPLMLALGIFIAGCTTSEAPPGDPAEQPGERAAVGYPLASGPKSGWATIKPEGEVFATGALVLRNLGDEDLRIERVRPVFGAGKLVYLGAQVSQVDRGIGQKYNFERWPVGADDPDVGTPMVSAEGAIVPHGDKAADVGVMVALGFRVASSERSTVKAVEVTYVGIRSGQRHAMSYPSTMAICSPPTTSERCEPEHGDD
jgi:hypothetical protein